MSRKNPPRTKSTSSTKNSTRRSAQRAGSAIYSDIMGIASSLLRTRKESGAEKISSVAGAARNFAAEMSDSPNIQTYVDAAADQMENLSDYVQNNTLEQMGDDALVYAKRYPITTVAFAIAVGFGFTRLMAQGGNDSYFTTSNGTTRKSGSGVKKSAATTNRAAVKAKGNGRAPAQETTNAS